MNGHDTATPCPNKNISNQRLVLYLQANKTFKNETCNSNAFRLLHVLGVGGNDHFVIGLI